MSTLLGCEQFSTVDVQQQFVHVLSGRHLPSSQLPPPLHPEEARWVMGICFVPA
jgi:hypothetical protein